MGLVLVTAPIAGPEVLGALGFSATGPVAAATWQVSSNWESAWHLR